MKERTKQPAPEPRSLANDDQRVWHTKQLFGHAREVLIQHGEQTYRLRITRQGKLILCK